MTLPSNKVGPRHHLPQSGTKRCDKILPFKADSNLGARLFHHPRQEHLSLVVIQRSSSHVAAAGDVARPSRASPSPAPTGDYRVVITRLVLCALAAATPSRRQNSMCTTTGRTASITTTMSTAVSVVHVGTASRGNIWRTRAPGSIMSTASAAETARSCSGMATSMLMVGLTARTMHGDECSPRITDEAPR